MKIGEIREHSDDQLQEELQALRRRQYELRAQAVTEKVQATSELGKTRKDIARILTVQRQRREAAQAGQKPEEEGRGE